MTDRTMIHVTDILSMAAGDAELEARLAREMRELADELNSALPGYEVMLAHLDTDDFLVFTKRPDPDEGSYWRELEEERREIAEATLPPEEDTGDD